MDGQPVYQRVTTPENRILPALHTVGENFAMEKRAVNQIIKWCIFVKLRYFPYFAVFGKTYN